MPYSIVALSNHKTTAQATCLLHAAYVFGVINDVSKTKEATLNIPCECLTDAYLSVRSNVEVADGWVVFQSEVMLQPQFGLNSAACGVHVYFDISTFTNTPAQDVNHSTHISPAKCLAMHVSNLLTC